MNKNFLYGDLTVKFLRHIAFRPQDEIILDVGCGTGFVFDVLHRTFRDNGMKGIGIDPAAGMLQIAIDKYAHERNITFLEGSFEAIPLGDRSVDRVISTLALHWVKSLKVAATEMRRVLKDTGGVDILMIAKDDGARFKKAIVNAQRKHLTFAQIMKTATLVQRKTPEEVKQEFSVFGEGFDIRVDKFTEVIYGSFEDHMTWWKARSSPVIAEVEDKEQFIEDLRGEIEALSTDKGIPFDTAYYWISIEGER